MNIFKKTYCRIFQTAFKIALPLLPYREPEIMNSVDELIPLLKSKKYTWLDLPMRYQPYQKLYYKLIRFVLK